MKLKNKLIIRNYTNLTDEEIIYFILNVVRKGKISKVNSKEQYRFVTIYPFSDKSIVIKSKRKNDTYTFYIYYDKRKGIYE